MVKQVAVDTTLDPTAPIGVPGVDAPDLTFTAPLFDQIASQADFQQATQAAPARFTTATASGKRSAIISLAKQYLGVPYVWGGSTPRGFDCSGLVQFVLGKNGVSMPRVAFQQAGRGKHVPISELQPGDLVGWYRGNDIPHIAIYLGNGQILEAPRTGLNVRIRSLGKGGFDSGAFGVKMSY